MRAWLGLIAFLAISAGFLPPSAFSEGKVKQFQVPIGPTAIGKLSVYFPEGYEESSDPYPVLYLLHGDSGDDQTMLGGGYPDGSLKDADAGKVVDRLVREGNSKPLIVACPAMGRDEQLLDYFVPFVDSTFRTIPKRESRAVAGHSLGGSSALYISLSHPEAFAIAGGLSSFGLYTTLGEAKAQDLKANPVLYWLYSGRNDQYEVGPPNRRFVDFLREKGLSVIFIEDDGNHESRVATRLAQLIEYISKRLKWCHVSR